MVRCKYQQISGSYSFQQTRKHPIERLQRGCKSLRVVPVTIERIEIPEVGNDQPALHFA